jgi:hypothetical protein
VPKIHFGVAPARIVFCAALIQFNPPFRSGEEKNGSGGVGW